MNENSSGVKTSFIEFHFINFKRNWTHLAEKKTRKNKHKQTYL